MVLLCSHCLLQMWQFNSSIQTPPDQGQRSRFNYKVLFTYKVSEPYFTLGNTGFHCSIQTLECPLNLGSDKVAIVN